MAIGDLLWQCPLCRTEASLRKSGRSAETCGACGATFRRGRGADIVATTAAGTTETRPAEAWAAALPPVRFDGRQRLARVRAREAEGTSPIRQRRAFLGKIERLGDEVEGRLTLEAGRLRFEPDGGSAREWPLHELTAIQPSSSTLQIKVRGHPVLSFRFVDASPRYWEELLRDAVRAHYRATGRGEVLEFQPRIATR